ncbi:calcium-regulated heat-stable protein 1 isoform X2 [Peromyscus leucopus]|uniref:calcium-regulated heat-stable protein 1 isoform X2 n=1 Tax=Peromyscus leucopus TaxID=10041 RepID=UPI001884EF55|nr:calcium-regulated heat-stable protein 1 isoform X2 [Peromyscus leucopus]
MNQLANRRTKQPLHSSLVLMFLCLCLFFYLVVPAKTQALRLSGAKGRWGLDLCPGGARAETRLCHFPGHRTDGGDPIIYFPEHRIDTGRRQPGAGRTLPAPRPSPARASRARTRGASTQRSRRGSCAALIPAGPGPRSGPRVHWPGASGAWSRPTRRPRPLPRYLLVVRGQQRGRLELLHSNVSPGLLAVCDPTASSGSRFCPVSPLSVCACEYR